MVLQTAITASGVAARPRTDEDHAAPAPSRLRCEWLCRGIFPGNLYHVQAAMRSVDEDEVRIVGLHVDLQDNRQTS